MSSPIPEWQTEEIVEDVPEFLGGKQRALPVEMVRHRGRVPPKKSAKNSVSPKNIIGIQTFECQTIEDDLATDSLCAPSPLTLEIGAGKPISKAPSTTTAIASASPPNKAIFSVRASPERGALASSAPPVAATATVAAAEKANTLTPNAPAVPVLTQPRPPESRTPRQMTANPRQAMPSKMINGTPNRLSPTVNEATEPTTATTTTTAALRKPTPPTTITAATDRRIPPTTGGTAAAPKRNTPPPSARSVDSESSTSSRRSRASSPDVAAGQRRVSPKPFSAPVGQSIPVVRRDTSALAAGQNNRSGGGVGAGKSGAVSAGGADLPRKAQSAGVPSALAAKQPPPLAAPLGRVALASAKPPTPAATTATTLAAAAAPQPASRTRSVPRSLPSAAAAGAATRTPLNVNDVSKADASLQPSRIAAPSPDVPVSALRQRETNSDKGRSSGAAAAALPRVLPQQQHRVSGDAGDYGFDDFFLGEGGSLPISEQEPRPVKQGGRGQNVNSSMVSSAGYSVLRGAFDSYATMDFNATLPNLNGTQNSVVTGSRVASARPANMMAVNGATALRAKSSFARGASTMRRPNGSAAPATARGRGAAGTLEGAAESSSAAGQAVKPAQRGPSVAVVPRVSPEAENGDGDAHDKHRKRAPQTKRELRRRSTEFEKV